MVSKRVVFLQQMLYFYIKTQQVYVQKSPMESFLCKPKEIDKDSGDPEHVIKFSFDYFKRYPDDFGTAPQLSRGASLPNRPSRFSEPSPKKHPYQKHNNFQRSDSLDKKKFAAVQKEREVELDPMILGDTPVLCNRYVVGKHDAFANNIPGRFLAQYGQHFS